MQLSFLNPFSDKFLQTPPDREEEREVQTALNSYGQSEDVINWKAAFSDLMNQNSNYDTYGGLNSTGISFEAFFISKRQRVNWYRNMAMYGFIRKCLNMVCNECISPNSNGEYAKFDISNAYKENFTEFEYGSLKREFDYVMNVVFGKEKVWDYFYKWLVDGELFLEICLNDEKNAVAGIKALPPYCTLAVYDNDIIIGYVQDSSLLIANTNIDGSTSLGMGMATGSQPQGQMKKFTRSQIAYSNFGQWFNNRNDIRGYLEPAIRPLNQLRAMEDAITIYFMNRAPEKRVFNIATGKQPPPRAAETVKKAMNKYKKETSLDPHTGAIQSTANVSAFTEDYWFAKTLDGGGSTVETLKGSAEFGGFQEATKMFKQEVGEALVIPASRYAEVEGSGTPYSQGTEGATLDEADFQKFCLRCRQKFTEIVMQVFITQLKVKGFKEKYLDSALYEISFHGATDFERMRDLNMAEKRGGVLGSFSQFLPTGGNTKPGAEELGPLFSKQFFMEKIMGLSTDEILLNKKMLENEVAALNSEAEKVKEEGGGEEDDEGIGF